MENVLEITGVKEVINNTIPVCEAARAIGLVKPKFDPAKQGFLPPQLEIIGTAFLLKDFNVIVTCKHVVENFINNLPTEISGMLVIGRQGNYISVSIDSVDFAHDLAVLRFIKNPNLSDELFNKFLNEEFSSGLEITDKYAPVSTKVAYAGYPLGTQLLNQKHDPTYAEGVIGVEKCETAIKKEIRITGPVVGGFSGSPIVLESDPKKVIGMISNGPVATANIFMGTSWEHIKALAELANS
jgi:V8-like Glu-specific endopeptidase